MVWQYFPVGFRFPARDFSEESKRACWEMTLSALFAADPKGLTLYDAQQPYDIGSDGPVYICIACYYGIKQARANAKVLLAMDGLNVRLCRNVPFMQANALESFGPYPLLGKIEENGTITFTEDGAVVLRGISPKPMTPCSGIRLLVVSDGPDAEEKTRTLGIAAADRGYRVQRLQISDGSAGFMRALVAERNGRYDTVTLTGADGQRKTEAIGVLPHFVAVLETSGKNEAEVEELKQKTRDLGYRDLCIGTTPESDLDAVEHAEQMLQMTAAGFETAAKQADAVLLYAHNGTAKAVLNRLNALQKPTYLLARDAVDPQQWMQAFPVLHGVTSLTDLDEPAVKRTFDEVLPPMLTKDVAKTVRI